MDDHPIVITGGAGPFEAAAIATVITVILEQEAAARSTRPRARVPSAWVRSGIAQPLARFNPPIVPEWGPNAP